MEIKSSGEGAKSCGVRSQGFSQGQCGVSSSACGPQQEPSVH